MASVFAKMPYEPDSRFQYRGLIWLFIILGVALRLFLLARPGHLFGVTEYDDGVYFGAALRLIGGVLPYKDFVLVQPPGIAVLLSPVALAAKVIGTANGLAVARILTVIVDGFNIALVGMLVRRRGRLAVVLSCGFMAIYPQAIFSSQTVLLEPFLNLFCLLGLYFCLDSWGFQRSGTTLFAGGLFLGIAGSIKVWAIIPVLVIVIVVLIETFAQKRFRTIRTLVSGIVVGFAIMVLPFFLAAPKAFLNQVILDQLYRIPGQRVGFQTRMSDIAGADPFIWLFGHAAIVVAALSFVFLIFFAVAVARTWSAGSIFSIFVIVTTFLVFVALLWPNDFYYHYADFLAPYLALTLAVAVSDASTRGLGLNQADLSRRAFATVAASVSIVTILSFVYESQIPSAPVPAKVAGQLIPRGACVLTDQASLLILSNRFFSTDRNCPQMLDSFGSALYLSGGKTIDAGAAQNLKVVKFWMSALSHASFVWLSDQSSRRVPTTGLPWSYLISHFKVMPSPGAHLGTIYVRDS
ncbi:MAG: hypothetical protein HKL84_08800 [Acidimicrobiaceae bacterium]|nr:hypothetical protein [Acidimicrobiaceae bacterium]